MEEAAFPAQLAFPVGIGCCLSWSHVICHGLLFSCTRNCLVYKLSKQGAVTLVIYLQQCRLYWIEFCYPFPMVPDQLLPVRSARSTISGFHIMLQRL